MKKFKVLNLYAGIGGNRKLWGDNDDITAVEINSKIAEVYAEYWPSDRLIKGIYQENQKSTGTLF